MLLNVRSRWRLWLPAGAVAAIAAAVGIFWSPSSLDFGAPIRLIEILLVVQAAALLIRSRYAFVCLVVVTGADLTLAAFRVGELGVGVVALAPAVASFVRSKAPRRYLVLGLLAGISTAGAVVAGAQGAASVPNEWIIPAAVVRSIIAFGLPAAFAEAMHGRALVVDALQNQVALNERERESAVREAASRERTEMARELHDIAAHHLSGIILTAQSASALASTDPGRAAEAMRVVTAEAQRTLTNLRQTAGLLRTGDGELIPTPSLSDLPALIADVSGRGVTIDLTFVGEERSEGPLAETAGYRMVQESIANAQKHSPGSSMNVIVRYGRSTTRIEVENSAPTSSPALKNAATGLGLIGMQERAALISGTLTSGRTSAGGWRNTLHFPATNTKHGGIAT